MVLILSQNVQGLRDDIKRREFFLYFKQKADIVCFQETHLIKEDEIKWRNEFRGVTLYAHGTTKSKGVFIGIKHAFPINVLNSIVDHAGRYIIAQLEHEQEKFVLVNLYAPSKDVPHFFTELFRKVDTLEGKHIFCGDFNPFPAINKYIC